MKIGITGSEGFAGGYIMNKLLSEGAFEVRSFEGDVNDTRAASSFVKDLHAVLHLAGENRNTDAALISSNTLGVMSILEVLKNVNPGARIVIASSFQVYRQWGNGRPIDESIAPAPVSIYGLSKLFAEELCKRYASDHGTRVTVLRLSNVFGPGCRPGYNSVIATFIDRALRKQPIKINGDGSSLRDYVYVEDVARSFIAAATSDRNEAFELYNICSGEMHSLNEIISGIENHLGERLDVEYDREFEEEHAFDACSNELALRGRILSSPLHEFSEAIGLTIQGELDIRGPKSS